MKRTTKVYHIENIAYEGRIGTRWSLLRVVYTKRDALEARRHWRKNQPGETVRIVKIERTVLP